MTVERQRLLLQRGAVGIVLAIAITSVAADENATELAKKAQNPVADMISLPFQYNANYNFGPLNKRQDVLNIQPVYPVHFNSDWNIITRTIIPIISQPPVAQDQDTTTGLGDIQFSAFLSPIKPTAGGWIWGAGIIAQFDTAKNDRLGQGKTGLGPTAVALRIDGPWLFGALINNIWSVSGGYRPDVNQMLIQPFINYNYPKHPGRYLTFSPIITANWEATGSGNTWLLPLGGGIGQIFRIGKQPINAQISAYYNVARPDDAPNWQLRLQIALLYPK
jgi:hypothetical protein